MIYLLFLGCEQTSLHTDSSSVSEEGTFSTLTYNVHGLPSQITGDDTTNRMEQIAPKLKEYDFISLQEDFDEENHQILIQDNNFKTVRRFNEKLEGKFYGSGLSFISAHEMDLPESYTEVHYESCYGEFSNASDCLASKGFQKVRISLSENCFLDFYNTHLEAGGGIEDHEVRVHQVHMLLDAIHQSDGNTIAFLIGDVNLRPSDEMDIDLWNTLLAEGDFTDSCEATSCSENDHIDRVLYWPTNQNQTCSVRATDWYNEQHFVDDAGVQLSDHPPIHVDFSWWLD